MFTALRECNGVHIRERQIDKTVTIFNKPLICLRQLLRKLWNTLRIATYFFCSVITMLGPEIL